MHLVDAVALVFSNDKIQNDSSIERPKYEFGVAAESVQGENVSE